MFEKELAELTLRERKMLEPLVESSVRDLVRLLDGAGEASSQQILLKAANIRAVFKLAGALRAATSHG